MRGRTAVITLLLAGLLPAVPARSEVPAADLEILQRVAGAYKGLRAYLFEGVIQVDLRTAAAPQHQTLAFLVAVDGKGRIRDQVTGGPGPGMIVSDGKETVTYNAQLGQYVRQKGGADSTVGRSTGMGVGGALVLGLAGAATGVVAVHHLPNEVVVLDGGKRDCLVLDVTYQHPAKQLQVTEDPRRYWIDERTHLVARVRTRLHAEAPQLGGKVERDETISFQRALANPAFADSLWAFRPPPGSREVSTFSATRDDRAAAFTGKPAFDFSLNDLKGRPHSLKSLRGKTVLLDFWATWCGPCRITMPQVAKIHAEYKGRGVEVMSINVGESATKAGDYIARNGYAFTTLLDTDRRVSTQYQVSGIPTLVVIDPAGKITDYLVGARDDVALRAALKKAGVK
jgi:thiol-disulfide isomerase/thioredoxin/outer membrane lipoprotein-sorting protein